MCIDNIKLFANKKKEKKKKKGLETRIQTIKIYSQDIGKEFGIENFLANNEKWKKKGTEGIEIPNQERIRTLGEKETYKYLGILEMDTIKQEEMKEKHKKSIKDERENFMKPSSAAGISSKG